jgi:outer membrane immunogenic protein
MKNLLLASIASVALMSGAAHAADMSAPAPMYKAPMMAPPPPSWTGCYGNVGFGYDVWNQDTNTLTAAGPLSGRATNGGRGWLGLAGAGCDVEVPTNTFFGNLVIGVFGDYQYMDVHGIAVDNFVGGSAQGDTKQNDSWSVGGRIGTLVTPTLLAYTNGGFTESHFNSTSLQALGIGPVIASTPSNTFNGWFVGGGTEYALNFSWLPIKGLFWRNEYRYSTYNNAALSVFLPSGAASGFSVNQKYYEQSVLSSLVWRFNWH